MSNKYVENAGKFFPMMYFHSPAYDEDSLLEECIYQYREALERGIHEVFPDLEPPTNLREFISFFRKTCLPYQTFTRMPETMYGFVPDVEELIAAVRDDEIYSVPRLENLPMGAHGYGLLIQDDELQLFHIEEQDVKFLWKCSSYWAKFILEKADEEED